MNLIFDFGNVLVDFKPVKYLSGLFTDAQTIEKLNDIVFKSCEWLLMDQGLLTHEQAIEIFCNREPDYASQITQAIRCSNDIVTRIDETIELLPKLKEVGHKIYYLSNMQKEIGEFMLENHEYISLFDGGVFSCDAKLIKPSPEIYHFLLEKYDLFPGDCIFFDDVEENVAAAEKEGIKGVLFTTAECVLEYL